MLKIHDDIEGQTVLAFDIPNHLLTEIRRPAVGQEREAGRRPSLGEIVEGCLIAQIEERVVRRRAGLDAVDNRLQVGGFVTRNPNAGQTSDRRDASR